MLRCPAGMSHDDGVHRLAALLSPTSGRLLHVLQTEDCMCEGRLIRMHA
jgi:hypothetical protein